MVAKRIFRRLALSLTGRFSKDGGPFTEQPVRLYRKPPLPPRAVARRLWPSACIIVLVSACSSTLSIPTYTTTLRCPECPTLAVSRIIDGDTFDSAAGRVRLYGVDTPERGKRCFGQATRWLRALAGGGVRVEPGPRGQDSGGRLLYYVYTEEGNSIDEILVREGMGLAWTRDGQHRDVLAGLEREARLAGKGCLW